VLRLTNVRPDLSSERAPHRFKTAIFRKQPGSNIWSQVSEWARHHYILTDCRNVTLSMPELRNKTLASTSNIVNLERFQSKALRTIVAARSYVPNLVIRRNHQIMKKFETTALNTVLAWAHAQKKWSAYHIHSVIVVFVILGFKVKFASLIPKSHKSPWTC
jgi:hypothetical protein